MQKGVFKNKCLDCQCRVDTGTKRCESCHNKYKEATLEERNKKTKEYRKKWYQNNKEKVKEQTKKRYQSLDFNYRQKYTIKYKYGIGLIEYETLVKKNNGCCAICGREQENGAKHYKKLYIDHDHTTRKIRGIICNDCNRGLGGFKDNIQFLQNAIKYLENANSKG